jgi:hypothetical protein
VSRYDASRAAVEILRATMLQAMHQASELRRASPMTRDACTVIESSIGILIRELHRLETEEERRDAE